MTIEEIRKGAPKGATDYWLSYKTWSVYYFRVSGKKIMMWSESKKWFSETSWSVATSPLY